MINILRELLMAQSSIAALIAGRAFVGVAPASAALQRIVLHQMSSDEQNDLENSGDARLIEIDIDCEGATAQDAYTLANAVRLCLKDFRGAAGSLTIDACVVDDEHEKRVEKTTQPNQTRQYAVTVPVSVFYRP